MSTSPPYFHGPWNRPNRLAQRSCATLRIPGSPWNIATPTFRRGSRESWKSEVKDWQSFKEALRRSGWLVPEAEPIVHSNFLLWATLGYDRWEIDFDTLKEVIFQLNYNTNGFETEVRPATDKMDGHWEIRVANLVACIEPGFGAIPLLDEPLLRRLLLTVLV